MNFDALPIAPALLSEIAQKGFDHATPVQAAVLDAEHAGADLLVTSKTGSGKTLAFGLALASQLGFGEGPVVHAHTPRALAVAPTRELALQVARELTWLYRGVGVRIATCVGGMDIRREMRALDQGAQVVVGTPGRVVDHLERGSLQLSTIEGVVLDEADEMLDLGFREELETILDACPRERRTLLFSATLPEGIEALTRKYTVEAHRIAATELDEPHQDIQYFAHRVAPREREHAVVNVLRRYEARSALVFCATREGVSHLCAALTERGFASVAISGELSQAERTRALAAIREGRARVLVATDVAARGIDLPAVGLVVHADLPHDAAGLLHRSGRTGRAGRKGSAVLLVPYPRLRQAERLIYGAKIQPAWGPVPSADDVRQQDRERFIAELRAQSDELDAEDMEWGGELLAQIAPEVLAAAFGRMQRRLLPAPEDLPMTRAWHDAPPPRPPRRGSDEEGAWFRVNVGRDANADPRWLLPMLCRRGNVRKNDIGRIEIGIHETHFEISPMAARHFADAARRPDAKDPHVRIEPVKPPPRAAGRPGDGPLAPEAFGRGPRGRGAPDRRGGKPGFGGRGKGGTRRGK